MKVLFFGKSGQMGIENVGDKHFLVELDDGDHPLPSSAVFRDRNTGRDPLIPVFGEVLMPWGADTSKEEVMKIMETIKLGKQGGQEVSISTRFSRMLRTVTKNLPAVIVLFVLVMAFFSEAL